MSKTKSFFKKSIFKSNQFALLEDLLQLSDRFSIKTTYLKLDYTDEESLLHYFDFCNSTKLQLVL